MRETFQLRDFFREDPRVSKPEKKSSSSLSLKKVSDENEMLATANLADESSKPVLLDVAVKCNRKESF